MSNQENNYPVVELNEIIDKVCENLYYLCSNHNIFLSAETYNLICLFFNKLSEYNEKLQYPVKLSNDFPYAFPIFYVDNVTPSYKFYPDRDVKSINIKDCELNSESCKQLSFYLKKIKINSENNIDDLIKIIADLIKTNILHNDDFGLQHTFSEDGDKQNLDLIVEKIVIFFLINNCIKNFDYHTAVKNLYFCIYYCIQGKENRNDIIRSLFKVVSFFASEEENEEDFLVVLEKTNEKINSIFNKYRINKMNIPSLESNYFNAFLLDEKNKCDQEDNKTIVDYMISNFLKIVRDTYNNLISLPNNYDKEQLAKNITIYFSKSIVIKMGDFFENFIGGFFKILRIDNNA